MDDIIVTIIPVITFVLGFAANLFFANRTYSNETKLIAIREKESYKTKALTEIRKLELENLIYLWETATMYVSMIISVFSPIQVAPVVDVDHIDYNRKKLHELVELHNKTLSLVSKCELLSPGEIYDNFSIIINEGKRALFLYELYFVNVEPKLITKTIQEFYRDNLNEYELIKTKLNTSVCFLSKSLRNHIKNV